MKKRSLHLFFLLFVCSYFASAQQIITDNTLQPSTLIENIVGNNCASVNNVISTINGTLNNIISYGSFERGTSNFPLQNGIVLSTGSVAAAGNNLIGQDLSEGAIDWTTDPDIQAVLGIDQTLNATSIEFDFVSANDFIAFKYLFASDEYQQEYPCNFRDVFAILIKPVNSAEPYVNIAVIPGTNTEVSTNTIHPDINGFCEAQNSAFFQGYNIPNTNFNGNTTVLTATSTIIPNQTYRIKFVIADHIDERFDSAVFIEAEGFGNSIDLGPDQNICGNDITLNADIDNASASYTWFLNGNPIPGESNPTLDVVQSGTYDIEISIPSPSGNCILSDTVEIEIIPFEEVNFIEDLVICDPSPSDGVFDFDFTDYNEDILSNLPSSNYNISYHLNQDDAQNNTNPIVGIYQNTENQETIFYRVESLDGSCLQLGNFSFSVNDSPNTQDFTVDVCNDSISDPGFSSLNQFSNTLANFESTSTVTYYLTEEDAINEANPVSDFPDFSSQPPFLVARVETFDNPSGCFSLAYLNFNYIQPPDIFSFALYDLCLDPNYEETIDGVTYTYENLPVEVNIDDLIAIIENEWYPGSTVRVNALLGLGNPRILTLSTNTSATIPLAISFDNGNCFSEADLLIHKNFLYNALGDEKTITKCDIANDDTETFNFVEINNQLFSDLDIDFFPSITTVNYYETEEDRDNFENEIDQTLPLSVIGDRTIYARIEWFTDSGNFSCSLLFELNLNLNPALELEPTTIDYCGNINPETNTTTVVLAPISETLENDLGIVGDLSYYRSFEDAENQENEIINNFELAAGEDLVVRVTNIFTGCFAISTIQINITDAIEASNPEPITICDADQDLNAIVNLQNVIDDLPNEDDVTFTMHNSFNDALNNTDPITITTNYNTSTKTLFIRADIESQNCFTILEFDILIYADPQLDEIADIINCEDNPNVPSNFIFEDYDLQITGNQTGMQVLYFETENDALNRENAIDKTVIYQNTSNPQTLYVRLENESGNSCFKITPMQIEVRQAPSYNAPSDVFECDVNGTGLVSTDLTEKINEITANTSQNLNVTFHLSQLNANFGTNAIGLNFTTISNPQLVYARIENVDSGCFEVSTFYVNTLALPSANYNQSLVACADNYETNVQWDLTSTEIDLLEGRQYNIDFSYYRTEADLENNINPILNPETYTNISNLETVFVKITNVSTDCYASVPLQLLINMPPQINSFETYEICANDENYVDLSVINEVVLDNTYNILISYYTSEEDANAKENAINTDYNYTNTFENLYLRVEYSTTNCYAVYPFELLVNPIPVANQPNDLVACDDDFDGFSWFNLSQQNAAVLNGQNPDNFSVSYYNSQTNAIENTQAINSDYLADNGEIIYARIENNTTGCFNITQFSIIVNALPQVPIEDQVICLDNLPLIVSANTNNASDTYLWSNNATTPEIEITEVGMYSVTVANEFGCETTTTFNITESQSAIIELVETIDFSDPNNITVTVNGIGDYLYQLNNGSFQVSNVFQNVPLGYNTITILDQNGCAEVTREVLVIDAPKHVTPNDDGDFDTWHIVGIETLPGSIIYIFDRYGKRLKQLSSDSSGWDGTYNGHNMPTADYWFLAEIKQGDNIFEFKGHFSLRR